MKNKIDFPKDVVQRNRSLDAGTPKSANRLDNAAHDENRVQSNAIALVMQGPWIYLSVRCILAVVLLITYIIFHSSPIDLQKPSRPKPGAPRPGKNPKKLPSVPKCDAQIR